MRSSTVTSARALRNPCAAHMAAKAAAQDHDLRVHVSYDALDLRPGLNHTLEVVVDRQDTAAHVGSGVVQVLATPVVINLFESAAPRAIEHLPPAVISLGTRLDVRHRRDAGGDEGIGERARFAG